MQFEAILDKKFLVWQRLTIKFEAENPEIAKEILEKNNGLPAEEQFKYLKSEILYNTEIPIQPKDETDLVWNLIDLKQVPQKHIAEQFELI